MNMSARIRRMWTVGLLLGSVGIPALSANRDTRAQTGTAVYCSDKMNGKGLSRKGETYDKDALTASTHKGYRLGARQQTACDEYYKQQVGNGEGQ